MSEENKVDFELNIDTKNATDGLTDLSKALLFVINNMETLTGKNTKLNAASRALERFYNMSPNRLNTNLQQIIDKMNELRSGKFNPFDSFINQIGFAEAASRKLLNITNKLKEIDMSNLKTFDITPLITQLDKIKSADTSVLDKFASISKAMNQMSLAFTRFKEIGISEESTDELKSRVNQISEIAKKFTEAFDNVKADGINAIVKALKELPKAMQAMEKLDHSKVGQAFDTLTQKLHKFLAELRESSSEIHAFSNIVSTLGKGTNTNPLTSGLRNVQREIKNTGTESDKANRKLSNMLSFGKVYAFYNQLRHYGTGFANMLNKAIDFTEIENYFSRAMGNMRSEAMKFQNQLSDMYGLAMPSMMQAQATFKNQLGALGDLSEDMSYMLSERLTKMSLDYASLYNVSVDSAVTKFQAALSKQVRPIRSQSGYDITQSVLGGTLENIGIYDRQIRDLSEVEKRLIIILTLQQQMARSAAMGDFARTIKV